MSDEKPAKRLDNSTKLTWQEQYPTTYLYSSPPEIDYLKQVLAAAKDAGRL